jgi:hypothetical protein
MNKLILSLILLSGISLQGCEPDSDNFYTKDYRGHSYIVYDGGNYDSGVVHDPDCRNDVKN